MCHVSPPQEVLYAFNSYFLVVAILGEATKKFIAPRFGGRDLSTIDIYDLHEITEAQACELKARSQAALAAAMRNIFPALRAGETEEVWLFRMCRRQGVTQRQRRSGVVSGDDGTASVLIIYG